MLKRDKRLFIVACISLIISIAVTVYGIIYRGWFAQQNVELSSMAKQPSMQSGIWKTLQRVDYQMKGEKAVNKVFGDSLKNLDGEIVQISGYMHPILQGGSSVRFALSSHPQGASYFEGKTGLETMVEVEASRSVSLEQKPITLRGKFMLNPQPETEFLFTLKDARLLDAP